MTLPDPPEGHGPDDPPLEDDDIEERSNHWLAVGLVLLPLVGVCLAGTMYLTAAPVKPVATESPSEAPSPTRAPVSVNPCDPKTFDANACAPQVIRNVSLASNTPPYTVIEIMCFEYRKPAGRRKILKAWTPAIGRENARAVLREILDYCPEAK